MKKRSWMMLMIVTIIFTFSTNGYSLHSVAVTINPFIAQPLGNPVYTNNSIGTFNALVTVTNTSNSVSYGFFALGSESFLTFNSISALSNNWAPNLSGSSLELWGMPTYPPLAPGASFSFMMNYTLTTSAYNAGWGSGSVWSMNGIVVEDPYTGFGSIQGFSTTVIPEPGTVMLLGFGLLGLGFFTRRRKKRFVL